MTVPLPKFDDIILNGAVEYSAEIFRQAKAGDIRIIATHGFPDKTDPPGVKSWTIKWIETGRDEPILDEARK